MTRSAQESLVTQVERSGRQAKESAGAAIEGLAGTADALDMGETAVRLRDTGKRLQSDTFNLMVMGRFKNGKSTLLNALLGGVTRSVDLAGHKGPMVVNDLPATATLTAVTYSDEPYVQAWGFDGTAERWPLSRYLRESTLGIDNEENEQRFSQIRQFEMGFPARLCQAGVTVYDSPGLDEHQSRTLITRDATARCDAAILVYRSDSLMGQNELMNAASLVVEGTRVFTVVNLWNERAVDDQLRGYVWNRYVRDELGGPKWAHQDLSAHDIHFVNAEKARTARYDENEQAADASGLVALEQRLADFLVRDRQHVHLQKFTTQATSFGDAIVSHIEQQRAAARADQDQLRQAYADIAPQMARARGRTRKLSGIFERYREEAQSVATASFLRTVARIQQELPDHLAATPLPSGEKFAKIFRSKSLQNEAAAAISAFVTQRVDAWGREVSALLGPIIDRLGAEVEAEIAAIARQYDQIHFELTGWTMDLKAGGSVVGTTERVLSAVAGFFLGDLTAALTGGAGGWRGAAGGIGAAFGSAFILGAVGVTSMAVFLPVVLAASLVFGMIAGGSGFENRCKAKAVKDAMPFIAALADEVGPKVATKVAEDFSALEKLVTDEITAIVDEEERNIARMVEVNQRDQHDREQVLARLDDLAKAVTTHRSALQEALTVAKQV